MLKIGFIVAVVLALTGGGAAGWFYFQGHNANAAMRPPGGQAPFYDRSAGTKGPAAPGVEAVYIALRPPFIANYDADGETGYYQISVELLTYNKELRDVVSTHDPRIRNSLLRLFNSQTTQSLRGDEAMDRLREAAKKEVDKILTEVQGQSDVQDVYFSGFVLQ